MLYFTRRLQELQEIAKEESPDVGPHISSLDLSGQELRNNHIENLFDVFTKLQAKLNTFPIKKLRLDNNSLTDQSIEIIGKFFENTHIDELCLSSNNITPIGANYLLNGHFGLLNLNDNPIGDSGAAVLAKAQHINSLNLSMCHITEIGTTVLSRGKFETLGLSDNDIGDTGASAFEDVPFVQNLDLSNCGITQIGAKALSKSRLKTLDLSFNHYIANEGASAFLNAPHIQELDLGWCYVTDKNLIKSLNKKFPNCIRSSEALSPPSQPFQENS